MGLVKTRRLAAMHPSSRCALRRTGKQQRAKFGKPAKKGGALPPHLYKSGGRSAAVLPRWTVLNI